MAGTVGKEGSTWFYLLELGKDANGKRKRKKKRGFKTKREAQKALAELETLFNKGVFIDNDQTTFAEFISFWLENYAKTNVSPKTYEGYYFMIKNHIKPCLGGVKLANLSSLHLQKYYSEKMNGGLSAQTVKHHHRLISKILTDAVKWQKVIRNVAITVDAPKPKKVEMVTLDANQVSDLFKVAKESTQYYPIIFTAIHTGMRRGELLGLRWKDVDFERKVLYVSQTIQSVTGLGLITKEPKNGKGRSVSMTNALEVFLKQHRLVQEENRKFFKTNYKDQDLVFAQVNGNPIQPAELSRTFNKLIKKAGVPHVRFHDLRHTHATLMLKQEVHPKIVQERLGHSSITITLDTYSHVLPNMQREAVKRFEESLNL
jgi:integrase